MIAYHDDEWGTPSHDDRHLFELLTLEGAQAGLSWSTILGKREGYRRAFAEFDPVAVARFTEADVDRLLADPGIVRNRAKIQSAISNAGCVLAVQKEAGSFDAYLWAFVGWRADRQRLEVAGRASGRDRRVARPLEGSQAPWLPIRRPDDVLRVHAGGGDGRTTTSIECFRCEEASS